MPWRYLQTCVVRNEEANVGIIEHGSNTDQSGSPTGNDRDVLPSILAWLALAVHFVVEVGNCLAQRLDARGRSILSAVDGNIEGLGSWETTLDVIVDLFGF